MNALIPAGLRAVGSELAQADAGKLARVVAIIDAMSERGAADALIARMRPRLAALGLDRPASLPRLLFMPLDPVLVDGAGWRPGKIGVPRTAIKPIARLVCAALGEATPDLCGHSMREAGLLARVGAALWPRAAAILADGTCPADWQGQTGGDTETFESVRRVCLSIWATAVLPPQPPEAARAVLATPAAARVEELAAVLAVAIEHVEAPGALQTALDDAAAPGARPVVHRAAELAFAHALNRAVNAPARASLQAAAAQAAATAALLEQIAAAAGAQPARRERLEQARRQADAACRASFTEHLATGLTPLAAGRADDAAVTGLERNARDLRRMEQAGRRLGGEDFYKARLREAALRLAAAPQLGRADRLRLLELLLGTDAAETWAANNPS